MSNDQKTSLTLSSSSYDKAKFFVQIVLPALGVLYASLALFWGFPKVEEVVGSITAVALFLGVVLKISSKNYDPEESQAGTPIGNFVIETRANGTKAVNLELERDPEDLMENEVIAFHLKKDVAPPEEVRE